MKKIFNLLCILFAITVIGIGYMRVSREKLSHMVTYEKNLLQGFYIGDVLEREKNQVYSILEELSKKYQGNIFKTYFAVDTSDNVTVEKGIIINNKESQVLEKIPLKNEKIKDLDFSNENLILSSEDIEEGYVEIKTFGYMENFIIKQLDKSYQYHGLAGNYFVELKDTKDYDKFLLDLQGQLKEKLFVEISIDDLKDVKDTVDFSQELIPSDFTIQGAGVILLSLLVFIVISSFRQFAILKSEGFGIYKAYVNLIGKTLLLNMLFSIILLGVFSITVAFDISYLSFTLGYLFKFYLLSFFFTILSVGILDKMNIVNLIKNRSLAKFVFCGNIIIKFIFLIFIITGSSALTDTIIWAYEDYKVLKSWEVAGDYGVFTGYYDFTNDESSNAELMEEYNYMDRTLYPVLNEIGSVYADVEDYVDKESFMGGAPFKAIMVNPNYLKEFPVVDEEGKKILVSEEEEKMVVLLPRKYEDQEDMIKAYYAWLEIEENISIQEYSYKTTEKDWDKLVKIIYIKDGQKTFSFNKNVNKKENNMIEEPIISVITRSYFIDNGKGVINTVNGRGTDDQLKVKLIDNDPVKTYEYIKPYLIKYGYEEILQGIVRANELKGGDYELLEYSLKVSVVSIVVGVTLYTIFAVQNLIIAFNMDGKKFAIKRLDGFSIIKTYKTHLLLNLAIVPFSFIVAYYLDFLYDKEVLFWQICLMGCYILIELILTRVFILKNEKRVKLRILKGE